MAQNPWGLFPVRQIVVTRRDAVGGKLGQEGEFRVPRRRLPPGAAGQEHDAAMPQLNELARGGDIGRHFVRPRSGDRQTVRASKQSDAGHRLPGEPLQQFAGTGDHDPGIGRVLADMANNAADIVLELDLGLAGEEHLVARRFQVVLDLE
jgi:hypothetical protein